MSLAKPQPLELSALKAAAALLPVLLRTKADATNAGHPVYLRGRIHEANQNFGPGTPEQWAEVALLPRVLAAMTPTKDTVGAADDEVAPAFATLRTLLESPPGTVPLGRETMQALYPMAKKMLNVFHGSFGGPPIPVSVCQMVYQQHLEDGDVERYMRQHLHGYMEDVHRVVAGYLKLPNTNNLAVVDNGSDGFNIVAESVLFNPAYYNSVKPIVGKTFRIMVMSTTYVMVRNCIKHWISRHNQIREAVGPEVAAGMWQYEVVVCELTEEMLNDVSSTPEGQEPKLIVDGVSQFAIDHKADALIFEHIIGVPSLIMPIESISKKVKAARPHTLIIADAAHAIGCLALDFSTPPAYDAWFSNCHKWLMSPKHCAVLWFAPRLNDYMHPVVKSNLYRGTPFSPVPEGSAQEYADGIMESNAQVSQFPFESSDSRRRSEFYWRGTRDHTVALSLPDLLWFRRQVGEDRIQSFTRELAFKAAQTMAKIWGTELLITNPEWLPPMVTLQLPIVDEAVCDRVLKRLLIDHGVSLQKYAYKGKLYCRITAQIYNDLSEFEQAAQILLDVLSKEQA